MFSLELNNISLLSEATIKWRDMADGRNILYVFTKSQHNNQLDNEIALFIGNAKELPDKSYFINSVNNNSELIRECLFGEFLINS